MANEREEDERLVSERVTRNEIIGSDGRLELVSPLVQRDYENGDFDRSETIAQHMEASDGTVIPATEWTRPQSQGGIALKRCDTCTQELQGLKHRLFHRNRTANAFSPAHLCGRCSNPNCRKSVCEKHYVQSDNSIRCQRCHRKHRLKQLVLGKLLFPIFFRKVSQ